MIAVTGDTHGLPDRFDDPRLRRLKKGDSLIICGDFGYFWDGGKREQRVLEKLQKKKYQILFLDGCHENYDRLREFPTEEWNGGLVGRAAENILHLRRGQVYQLGGTSFFTFGGGESRDKQMYADMGKWWPEEMPTLAEMAQGVQNLDAHGMKVDYVLTHSPAPRMNLLHGEFYREKTELEMYFERLAKKVQFRRWYFASLHIDRHVTEHYWSLFREIAVLTPEEYGGKEVL